MRPKIPLVQNTRSPKSPKPKLKSKSYFFRIKFEHETTDQGWRDLRDKWYFKKCFEQKNRAEWKGRTSSGGKLPATEACYAAMWDAANARHYHWEMDFVKVCIIGYLGMTKLL